MSSIVIKGDTSGQIEIAAPAVAGTTTLTLPTGSANILTDTSSLSAANLTGALPALDGSALTNLSGVGKVLQVLSAIKTDTQLFSSSSTFSDISGLSLSITPSSTSSKILVFWAVAAGNGSDGSHFYTRLLRGATSLAAGAAASNRTGAAGLVINTGHPGQVLMNSSSYLDSPNTTSATTYKLQGTSNWSGGGSSYVNRSTRDVDLPGYDGRSSSSLTIMEIGP
jgi:hypothetical protein